MLKIGHSLVGKTYLQIGSKQKKHEWEKSAYYNGGVSMTSYTITVNGKSYDVIVQKKRETSATSVGVAQTATVATTPVTPAPTSKSVSTAGGEGVKVVAPMPGKIIEIKINVGDNVKKGQALIIMEAMKMHNSVLAANEGIISNLFVKVNDSVQSGQSLLSIR